MRQVTDGARLFGNEWTAAIADAMTGTLVLDGTSVSQGGGFDVDATAGEIAIDGTPQAVTADSVTLSDTLASGEYRYDVLTRDGAGSLTVTEGNVGAIDQNGNVTTAVGAPNRPAGHVLLATAEVHESGIDTLFDNRVVHSSIPGSVVQGAQFNAVISDTAISGSYDLDVRAGSHFDLAFDGDANLGFTNPNDDPAGHDLTAYLQYLPDRVDTLGLGSIDAVAIDGGELAISPGDDRVRVYDLATLTEVADSPLPDIGFIGQLDFSSSRLAVEDEDSNDVVLFDRTDYTQDTTLTDPTNAFAALEFDGAGDYLAVYDVDDMIYIYETTNDTLDTSFGTGGGVQGLAWNSNRFAYAGRPDVGNEIEILSKGSWSSERLIDDDGDPVSLNDMDMVDGKLAWIDQSFSAPLEIHVYDPSNGNKDPDSPVASTSTVEDGWVAFGSGFGVGESLAWTVTSETTVQVLDTSDWSSVGASPIDHGINATFTNGISYAEETIGVPFTSDAETAVIDASDIAAISLTWPSSVVWDAGTAVDTLDEGDDVELRLISDDAGAEWRARETGRDFA